jgi:hypothetical protein|tara:strand:- start:506 stop:997 length:492 start_codon:yes stop_codon:yes gene_type:complete
MSAYVISEDQTEAFKNAETLLNGDVLSKMGIQEFFRKDLGEEKRYNPFVENEYQDLGSSHKKEKELISIAENYVNVPKTGVTIYPTGVLEESNRFEIKEQYSLGNYVWKTIDSMIQMGILGGVAGLVIINNYPVAGAIAGTSMGLLSGYLDTRKKLMRRTLIK